MNRSISRRNFLMGLGALGGMAALPSSLFASGNRTTFEFLVLGDSLVWGQGLEEEQKFYSLTKRWLADEVFAGTRTVNLNVKAHSGSTILLNEEETAALAPANRDALAAVHPEINVSFPSIKAQLDSAQNDYQIPANVDLVMLSGGIPEVGVANILNPFKSNEELRADIKLYCYEHMSALLAKTADAFPNATIAVIGYYPIITRYTPVKHIVNDVLELYNWPGWTKPLVNNRVKRLFWRRYRGKMIKRSQIWLEDSTWEFGRAVKAVNDAAGFEQAVLIEPPFTDANGYGAKETFLYKVGRRGRPADPMGEIRGKECRPELADLRRQTGLTYRTRFCELASIGHPTPQGSAAIAEAVKLAILPLLSKKYPRMLAD